MNVNPELWLEPLDRTDADRACVNAFALAERGAVFYQVRDGAWYRIETQEYVNRRIAFANGCCGVGTVLVAELFGKGGAERHVHKVTEE